MRVCKQLLILFSVPNILSFSLFCFYYYYAKHFIADIGYLVQYFKKVQVLKYLYFYLLYLHLSNVWTV